MASTLFRDPVEIYGGTITLMEDTFAAQETVRLAARTDLTLAAALTVVGNVTLNAGTAGVSGAITRTAGLLTAPQVTANAVTGITLTTKTDALTAHNTGTGNITITETDALNLADVDTANGSITVMAGGKLTVTDVDALGAGSDVTLTATNGAN